MSKGRRPLLSGLSSVGLSFVVHDIIVTSRAVFEGLTQSVARFLCGHFSRFSVFADCVGVRLFLCGRTSTELAVFVFRPITFFLRSRRFGFESFRERLFFSLSSD
jgi:hypothetical protein